MKGFDLIHGYVPDGDDLIPIVACICRGRLPVLERDAEGNLWLLEPGRMIVAQKRTGGEYTDTETEIILVTEDDEILMIADVEDELRQADIVIE